MKIDCGISKHTGFREWSINRNVQCWLVQDLPQTSFILSCMFELYALLVNFMCGNLRSGCKPKYLMMNVKPHTFLALSDSAALHNSCHLFVISGMSSTGGCCMFIPVTFAIQSRWFTIRVYTPYLYGTPHPVWPNDATPVKYHLPSPPLHIKGPVKKGRKL